MREQRRNYASVSQQWSSNISWNQINNFAFLFSTRKSKNHVDNTTLCEAEKCFLRITETHPSFMTESVFTDASSSSGFGGGTLHFLFTLYRGDTQKAISVYGPRYVIGFWSRLYFRQSCTTIAISGVRMMESGYIEKRRRKGDNWWARQ